MILYKDERITTMNYLENMSISTRRDQWFRRMFAVALLMGLGAGFVFGRLTVEPAESDPEPTQTVTPTPEVSLEPVEPEPVYLGEFRVTAYCACEICCGQWAENRPNGIVYGASGEPLVAGVSCASPLPFGTVLEVEGVGTYIVQDRTASWVVDKYGENLVDIYFDDHQAALEFGIQDHDVYMQES